MNIEKITYKSLSDIFKGEASEFTPWLSENLDRLEELTGITLYEAETEHILTTLRVDIVAKTSTGDNAIIENQFGISDHDHLGKLISYAATMGAKYAFWICETARPEHIQAIMSLNSLDCTFILIEARVITIGSSSSAVDLRIAAKSKEIIKEEELSQWRQSNKEWWSLFLPMCKDDLPDFYRRSPSTYMWMDSFTGNSGVRYSIVKRKDSFDIKLMFCSSDKNWNTERFFQFQQHKEEIEYFYGESLEWDEMPNNKACIVRKSMEIQLEQPKEIAKHIISVMKKFQQATRPYIK